MKNATLILILLAYFPLAMQAFQMKSLKHIISRFDVCKVEPQLRHHLGSTYLSIVGPFGLSGSQVHSFRRSKTLHLNCFLFDASEIDVCNGGENNEFIKNQNSNDNDIPLVVTLPKDDYRTVHAAKVLVLLNGDTIRAGIVKDRDEKEFLDLNILESVQKYCGYIMDEAKIIWIPEGIKKVQPTKNGDPPGSLRISLTSFEDELDSLFPSHEYAKAIAHPLCLDDDSKPLRMKNISFQNTDSHRIVVTVGPERGWAEI